MPVKFIDDKILDMIENGKEADKKEIIVAKDIIDRCFETDHESLMEALLVNYVKEHYPDIFKENIEAI